MLIQLSEKDKFLVKDLFSKKQPNNSALWCYFEGNMSGKTYVDDINNPTKAICKLDMSWTYISDDADLSWIKKTCTVEITSFTSELFDKLPSDFQEWHIQNYGSKEEFLKKTHGYYAVENGEPCCECELAFTSNGCSEIGIFTFEKYRKKGYAFATCLHAFQELDERGLKALWACDVENVASVRLAEKLGFVNPVKYDFIFFPHI